MPANTNTDTNVFNDQWLVARPGHSFYAEVSTQSLKRQRNTIEQLIEMAFDDLGARHLEVRVFDERALGDER